MPDKKAHHPFTLTSTKSGYDGTTTEIGVNNGSKGISLGMRYSHEYGGPSATLTPTQARELAQDLIERADELEAS